MYALSNVALVTGKLIVKIGWNVKNVMNQSKHIPCKWSSMDLLSFFWGKTYIEFSIFFNLYKQWQGRHVVCLWCVRWSYKYDINIFSYVQIAYGLFPPDFSLAKKFLLKTWPSHHQCYLAQSLVGKGRGMDYKWRFWNLKHQPSHWYLEMRQECRTFKSVTSSPCDWLLLVLALRMRGATWTKTDGKIDEW